MTTTVLALPSILDPMYWLGEGGPFASAVLPGILVIVFIIGRRETVSRPGLGA